MNSPAGNGQRRVQRPDGDLRLQRPESLYHDDPFRRGRPGCRLRVRVQQRLRGPGRRQRRRWRAGALWRGPDGLTLISAATEANLPEPTALAFSALTGGQVQFYAATAGRDEAELVTLRLEDEAGPGTSPSATSGASSSVQLVSLSESSLPLVATVLTLTIAVSGDEFSIALAETEATVEAAFLPGTGVSLGQGLSSQGHGGLSGDDPAESDEASAVVLGTVTSVISPWERFVIGLDQALEQFQRENPNGVAGAQNRDPAGDRPESPAPAAVPAHGGPTRLKSSPTLVPGDDEPDWDDNPGNNPQLQAIDAIIQSGWGREPASLSRERLSLGGRRPGFSSVAPPAFPRICSSSMLCCLHDRNAGEAMATRGFDLHAVGPGRSTFEVGAPDIVIDKSDPDPVLTSLVCATIATEWARTCRWNRSVPGRWPAELGNPVGRRRSVIR